MVMIKMIDIYVHSQTMDIFNSYLFYIVKLLQFIYYFYITIDQLFNKIIYMK